MSKGGLDRHGKGEQQAGRSNYPTNKIDNVLESIMVILPSSGGEWNLVANCHASFHPDLEPKGNQLKTQIDKLSKVKKGTGDPSMPDDMRQEK